MLQHYLHVFLFLWGLTKMLLVAVMVFALVCIGIAVVLRILNEILKLIGRIFD